MREIWSDAVDVMASIRKKDGAESADGKVQPQGRKLRIKESIIKHLQFDLARNQGTATLRDWWVATCLMAREMIMAQFIRTQRTHHGSNVRKVYYISLEYLPGRLLKNNLINFGILGDTKKALEILGQNFDDIENVEPDMGLGNGGLGRLASCFQDSLATLNYPAVAYGIHYELGLFRQKFVDGKQVETPDSWLLPGTPWQVCRPENTQNVKLYGSVEFCYDNSGRLTPLWKNCEIMQGVPWDISITGYKSPTVNFMRLWEARSAAEFDLKMFNDGKFFEAMDKQTRNETISKVLYPNDSTEGGKILRLTQQYFFVSCSIQDIIRRFKNANKSFDAFPEKVAIQLNDTHPTIAVVELLRILLDEELFSWERAWDICKRTFSYTNHTLLPEALEEWPAGLFEYLLPRHYQLICEINRRFLCGEVEKKWPGDDSKKRALSIISGDGTKVVRMAHLAVACCEHVNGVAAMHSDLVKKLLFPLFNELYPQKFTNVTNGVTPRMWLRCCNPNLSKLLDRAIGQKWTSDLGKLRDLEKFSDDPIFQQKFLEIKRLNKVNLAKKIASLCGIEVNVDSLFDVQIKRLHEYKRQHLNLLHILTLYRRVVGGDETVVPRTFIFGAKAAPGYYMAKQIIHAINVVADKVNANSMNDKIRIAFLPNYNVSLACDIIPAADLSEQISTAGKEASGTGNMKLAMNGACTICTLDGANVEIKEEVGDENIFVFGHTEGEIKAMRERGYNPYDYYNRSEDLHYILDWMASSNFVSASGEAPLRNIRNNLLDGGDPFFALADFESYVHTQRIIDETFQNRPQWAKKAILNVTRSGKFSSDRAIRDYATNIWNLSPVAIK
ncbi:MAG: glycogen/starch/alpha-glucan phosphorylase [Puniceicoccales bacterium]|jgi:starch phosphorylase|nr:glycogen/starch/alpha-glucan phosphorylase [Puniceicoccales bacterium]